MQPTKLLDNLNSDYWAASSALQPKNAPQKVLVYVESHEDVAFWRNILHSFESSSVKFEINIPSVTSLEKGKKAALAKSKDAGTHLIICVDSDYDYLLQDTTEQSDTINSSKYIFQTYTYSLENLLCYSSSLHRVCVQATKNDNQLLDWEVLLVAYSQIIYKLFLWSVYFSLKQDTSTFTISDFNDTVKILDKADAANHFRTALEGLQRRVDAKLAELKSKFAAEVESVERLSEQLKPLGLDQDNTYLFVQGHTVKDNVVLMFLNPICAALKKEKETQIKDLAKGSKTQLTNELNHYRNQQSEHEVALNHNTEFKDCFLYKKLHDDLTEYVKNFKK
jgi:Protein of unknown function (DUF4435)